MTNIPYFIITVAECESNYRQTALAHVGTIAQELLDHAGALVARYGVIATGYMPGALILFQGYEHLDGLEKALDVYASSSAYSEFIASGKTKIVLRNILKTYPLPFDAKAEESPKYAVLTRASSSNPMIDEISQMAPIFSESGALTMRYGTMITGSNAGSRLLGVTYPSMDAIEKAYDLLGADDRYQSLLKSIDVNMRNIIRLNN